MAYRVTVTKADGSHGSMIVGNDYCSTIEALRDLNEIVTLFGQLDSMSIEMRNDDPYSREFGRWQVIAGPWARDEWIRVHA
jgi:hypothetical protein